MDTDSLIYHFKEDFNKFIKNNQDLFDTSNYPKDHELYNDKNKKVIGKFKDELGGKKMVEFVGLRSKSYAYRDNNVHKKLKGIKKSVLDKEIKFEHYKKCSFDQQEYYHKQCVIRSYDHNIYTEELNKKSLCWIDDKRCIQEDSTDTLAWGHWRIENN
ncbi:hypothetical protein QE152_g35763 [Popillia japonica]|uniref:Uncharacterized protein n=1 Tax=Popillia japonica TaxID=7064 RepID=A0AAW1IFC8_POPJA